MEKRRLILYFFQSFRYIIDMITKIMKYIQKYQMIESNDTIVAGVSGGADSVCLLFVLLEIRKKIPFSIEVVHVNHGIRSEAGEDADFVKNLCDTRKLPYHLVSENIREMAKQSGRSEEEEGRLVRYRAFQEILGDRKGKIAVAHNSNDRAETMLFNLFRGAGLAGAGGIRPVNGNIIRPLLCVQRKEIEDWLEERKISYCTDHTNEGDKYTRNRIRHHILPYAQTQICPGAIANMNRAAQQLQSAEEYVKRQTIAAMDRCVKQKDSGVEIDLSRLEKEDLFIQNRILLECIRQTVGCLKDITAEHIQNIQELFEKQGSKEIHLPYGLVVYKKYDLGMIQKEDLKRDLEPEYKKYRLPVPGILEIPGLGSVEITVFPYQNSENIPQKSYTKWFDYDKISSCVMFRTKEAGDYLTINAQLGHKLLQDYFVNEKIPKDERNNIYLLADGSHVLWIPGYRISEYYKVGENTKKILQVNCSQIKSLMITKEGSHEND